MGGTFRAGLSDGQLAKKIIFFSSCKAGMRVRAADMPYV
jgi:hypothetical protein